MTPSIHNVSYGSQTISFELQRSIRKTLAIHVHPDQSVEVVAPSNANIEKIYSNLRKKAGWVKAQQLFFNQFYPKTPPRQYISGESHRYLGRQLRLKITRNIISDVKISGGFIVVSSPLPNNRKLTKQIVESWLKERAHEKFKVRLELCIKKFSRPEFFTPHGLIIRQLSNRWGSMTAAKNLVLNVNLIHAPIRCIDYVIVHELCHIQHPNHGPKFWKLLTSVSPDWQKHKQHLEKLLK